jgi:choline dehydrogenase-like flavoprotein
VHPQKADLAISANASFRASALDLWFANKTGPFSSNFNYGSFLPLPVISNRTESLVASLLAQDATQYLPAGTHPTVVAGFETRRNASAKQLLGRKSAIVEAIFEGSSAFTPILLKPQSRGTILIAPNDDGVSVTGRGTMEPIINFGTLTNPIDVEFMLEILRFWRSFIMGPAMQEIFAPVETSPGGNVTSDEDITQWLRDNMNPSNGHIIGTAALGPVELGGVVRPDLTVHGTVGLSIADNSIIPLIPGTHTSSTAYAIGERVCPYHFP